MTRTRALRAVAPVLLFVSFAAGFATVLSAAAWWRGVRVGLDERLAAAELRLPSRAYARPLVIAPGDRPTRLRLSAYLDQVGYRRVETEALAAGEYRVEPDRWRLATRGFTGPDGPVAAARVTLELDARGRFTRMLEDSGAERKRVVIEPPTIGLLAGVEPHDRDPIPLDELPSELVHAFLAIEDLRFFEHRGIDPQRVIGAALANLRAGGITQGGSTITQQWVKNALLSPERTFNRKLEEAALALAVEERRSKEEILEAYLNEIYLGQRGDVAIHGVGSGARHHFGKDARSLGLSEAALLAALARGPSRYAPRRNPEAALERRNLVLRRMHEEALIETAAYEQAIAEPLGLRPERASLRSTEYFLHHLRSSLSERHPEDELASAGLVLHTTLDWRLQLLAEEAVRDGLADLEERAPKLLGRELPLEGALVALEPRSGAVLAMVGGRNYGSSQFNRAVDARRQPGSVFKPVVALAAIAGPEPPFTLASVFVDEPLTIPAPEPLPGEEPEEDWSPLNHDEEFHGEVTVRRAIEESLNVPTVLLAQETGLRRVVRTARALGIRSRLRPVPSIALGTFEVSLLEMTHAYGTLASEGWRSPTHLLRELRTREGADLPLPKRRAIRAFSAAETWLVTTLLQGVVARGTGKTVRNYGYAGPLAGKTGSSDDYRDGWFIGYTPEVVVGVWVGFDDGQSIGLPGAFTALPIFTSFLKHALGPYGGEKFEPPRGVEQVEVMASRNHPAGLRCRGAPEWYLEDTTPLERCGLFGLPPVSAEPGRGIFDWLRSGND
jgi:penicillin-binding protein 1B